MSLRFDILVAALGLTVYIFNLSQFTSMWYYVMASDFWYKHCIIIDFHSPPRDLDVFVVIHFIYTYVVNPTTHHFCFV